MNFITMLTDDGQPTGSHRFFERKDDALAFCTTMNQAIATGAPWHWIVRELREVF